ncbi:cell division protein FtsA [Psychrobacter sp. I-STPA10]|uniref:cell division protein FtsA n=1 Tax=Psychrobacter sp. I-STPA10 TaxID=2585769 RepID=UPI001E63F914|nr:cell division protein FtsA [Psychrobacter sp. I-STPA10]
MKNTENLVVVHLSATAIYAVIGQVVSADDIRIMGVGQVKSDDFFRGQIIHWERLKKSIKQAIFDAEEMANCRVHSVWLSLSTPELFSKNSFGTVSIETETVENKDIVQALSLAKAADMPNDYYLMHHCQQGIVVDGQESMVDDAIGMYTKQISVMYHLMMLPVASGQNLQRLLQACDVSIDHILFDAVSSAEYSLMPDEKRQGVCLLDIGASTTSVCVYRENKLIFTHCVPEGSYNVTMDISVDLGLTMAEAEKLKKTYGTVDVQSIDASQFMMLKRQGVADEVMINLLELAKIMEARYIEILRAVFVELNKAGLVEYLDRGIVLSGGGSQVKGMVAFCKRLLNMPVYLTNSHPAITAYNHFDDDKRFEHLTQQVNRRAYQTAFGALLYTQSEQFQHSEKSSPDALQYSRFSRIRTHLDGFLKRIL